MLGAAMETAACAGRFGRPPMRRVSAAAVTALIRAGRHVPRCWEGEEMNGRMIMHLLMVEWSVRLVGAESNW
ncbi:hypothetical protein GCM10022226_10050 [Sphaerisporangium flaviroseum]|uniref:Uncharacterized protein n=1 Tax=Sphaerisporangium flaviroseum TaxID=509199 RepID=A0ABP7HN40_9ACTN